MPSPSPAPSAPAGQPAPASAPDNAGWWELLLPPTIVAILAYFVLLAAASLVAYPVAWLFGFRPRKWWMEGEELPDWVKTGVMVLFVPLFLAAAVFLIRDFRAYDFP